MTNPHHQHLPSISFISRFGVSLSQNLQLPHCPLRFEKGYLALPQDLQKGTWPCRKISKGHIIWALGLDAQLFPLRLWCKSLNLYNGYMSFGKF
nr:hypothetical protein Iba_chr11aCG3170 [Ipomoea batatas]